MGSSQSTKRPKMLSLFPSSSDYTHLPSSPKQQLLKNDALKECNCFDQYEVPIRDMLGKNKANEEKVTELERKVERLDHALVSKSAEMEENIKKNTDKMRKTTDLEKKIAHLEEGNKRENISNKKRVTELEQKVECLERLLISKNASTEGSITELQARTDGLALVSLSPSRMHAVPVELNQDVDEPEYVNRIMSAIVILVFVVFISIGMQL